MKCPKCHYLSFEPEPRCRNCGYDLSLGQDDLDDVIVKPDETPLTDFELRSADDARGRAPVVALASESRSHGYSAHSSRERTSVPAAAHAKTSIASPDAPVSTPKPAFEKPAPVPLARPALPTPTSEGLPLFLQGLPAADLMTDDDPLSKLPRTPRAPLSVRRPTPAPNRMKQRYAPRRPDAPSDQPDLLDRDAFMPEPEAGSAQIQPSMGAPAITAPEAAVSAALAATAQGSDEMADADQVGPTRRLIAAAIDGVFLGAINIVLIWLTLQRCDLTMGQLNLLPVLPLAAFLFIVDSGYLLLFTVTNGQTVGKMAVGLRVVDSSTSVTAGDRVTFAQAALRALATFPSVLAFGAGFLPALAGSGQAFHDRVAHTRVVRA
jgi:uncharacterized RDD family membrane protein YckC